jgi:hypothetical protein
MIYLILFALFILPYNGNDRLETSNAILEVSQESAFNTKVINKRSGTLGIGQISPRYLKAFQKKIGKPYNPLTLVGGLRLSAHVFGRCIKRYKVEDHRRRYACYFAGMLNPCTVHLEKNKRKCPETYKHVLDVEKKLILIR